MITLEIDSRYVNAAVYVAFDVALVAACVAAFGRLRSSWISYRLCNGKRVDLKHSSIGAMFGSTIADGTFLWMLICATQFAVLASLFVATLGINGRTCEKQTSIQRRYLTSLPLNDKVFTRRRQSVPIFSSCVDEGDGVGFKYYPSAFDTDENVTIFNDWDFTDFNSSFVPVNLSTVVCQNFGEFPPLLDVKKCGQNIGDCSNLNMSGEVVINLEGNGDSTARRLRNVHTDKYVLRKRLAVPAGVLSSIPYTYLICSIRAQKKSRNIIEYPCTAGHLDVESSEYTFRIGTVNFNLADEENVLDPKQNSTATFFPHSHEVKIEYNIEKNGGMIFVETLSFGNGKFVSAREFLDSIIISFAASEESRQRKLWKREPAQATDIELYTVVIYGSLVIVLMIAALLGAISHSLVGPRTAFGRICADVSSYQGLMHLLQHKSGRATQNMLSLGVVCDKEHQSYELLPVEEEHILSKLPKDAMLGCCLKCTMDCLKANMEKLQKTSSQSCSQREELSSRF